MHYTQVHKGLKNLLADFQTVDAPNKESSSSPPPQPNKKLNSK